MQELFVVGHLPLQGRSHVSVRNNKYLKLSFHMHIAEGEALVSRSFSASSQGDSKIKSHKEVTKQ